MPRPAGRTLRALSSLVAFFAVAAMMALFLVDVVARGAWHLISGWAPLCALVLWLLWLVLVRSSVTIGTHRVIVRNLARVHEIPWSHVAAVRTGPQLWIETTDGSRVTCMGAPFPRRPGIRSRRGDESPQPQEEIVRAFEQARDAAPDDAMVSRWDRPVLIVGLILTVLAAGSWAFLA